MEQNELMLLWCKQYIDKELAKRTEQNTKPEPVDLSTVYPVGAVYISTVETNPAELFGFGEWQQIKDTFLLAAGDSYSAGSTGGEAEHTLTGDELPAVRKKIMMDNYVMGYYNTNASVSNGIAGLGANIGTELLTEPLGLGKPHNNMPPYLAVYVWQRIQ